MDNTLYQRSIRAMPDPDLANSITFMFTTIGSEIEPWGANWVRRDRQLREFINIEPFLKATIFNIAVSRAALPWEIDGPPRTARRVQEALLGSDWIPTIMKTAFDVLTQDNAGFIEIVRDKPLRGRPPETGPLLGVVHLSADRCIRTGNPMYPVLYIDDNNEIKKLPWWRVMTIEEMPHPSDDYRGRQICFVSRVLEGARVISEVQKYKEEKVSGRFSKALHLVGGVAQHELDNAKVIAQLEADNAGLHRYMEPIMMASLDPNAQVSHVQIDLASLPDNFDEDTLMKWYITLLALASGGDFQDLAPLPGGNLGTASQSETLDRKSRTRGAQMWIKLIEQKMRLHNVLPANVSFRYKPQDALAELEQANLRTIRANARKIMLESQQITPEVARLMAVDDGDLKNEYLAMMGDSEQPSVTVDDNAAEESPEVNVVIDEAEPPNPVVAAKAAKYMTKMVRTSRVNAVAPLPEEKLLIFEQALRNNLKCGTIGTDAGWMTAQLIDAAVEAGIPPISIRHRLKDEHMLTVGNETITRGTDVIYRVPSVVVAEKSTKTSGECIVCGEDGILHSIPTHGKNYLCERHAQGLPIPDTNTPLTKLLEDAQTPVGDAYIGALQLALGRSLAGNELQSAIEEVRPILHNRKALGVKLISKAGINYNA